MAETDAKHYLIIIASIDDMRELMELTVVMNEFSASLRERSVSMSPPFGGWTWRVHRWGVAAWRAAEMMECATVCVCECV